MTSTVGDAHLARDHSRRLRLVGEVVSESQAILAEHMARLRWEGNRANRFRADSLASSHELIQLAELLFQTGADLDRYGDWVEEREGELRRLESRVRSWALNHPAGAALVDPAEPDASCIAWFPPPLDPEWEVLAARLQRLGASF